MSWAPTTQTNGTTEISGSWVKANKDSGSFQFVDCREQAEWDAQNIPGAQLIPLSDWASALHKLDKSKPVVVHCRSGARSAQAANFLIQHGYQAASMAGGIIHYPF